MPQVESLSKQEKTFLRWVNTLLGEGTCDNLEKFSDGVLILKLAEKLTTKKVGRYHKKPRGRFQKLENINKFLSIIKEDGYDVANVCASDIEGKNNKILLGLLWRMMYQFELGKSSTGKSEEGILKKMDRQRSQAQLITWAQSASGVQASNAAVVDFKDSFKDGKALASLVNSLAPGSIDQHEIETLSPLEITKKAMKVAEEVHGVQSLADAEDIVNGSDKHSLMIFLAKLRDVEKTYVAAPGNSRPHSRTHSRSFSGGRSRSMSQSIQARKGGPVPVLAHITEMFSEGPSSFSQSSTQPSSQSSSGASPARAAPTRKAPARPPASKPTAAASTASQSTTTSFGIMPPVTMGASPAQTESSLRRDKNNTLAVFKQVARKSINWAQLAVPFSEKQLADMLEATDNNIPSAVQLLEAASAEQNLDPTPKSFGNLLNRWKSATGTSEDEVVHLLTEPSFTKRIFKPGFPPVSAYTAREFHKQARLGPGGVAEALKILAGQEHKVNDLGALSQAVHAVGSQRLKTRSSDKRQLRAWLERPDRELLDPKTSNKKRKIPERSLGLLLDASGTSVGVVLNLKGMEEAKKLSTDKKHFADVKDMAAAAEELCKQEKKNTIEQLLKPESNAFTAQAKSTLQAKDLDFLYGVGSLGPKTVQFLEKRGPFNDVLDCVVPLQQELVKAKKHLFEAHSKLEDKHQAARDQVRNHLLDNTRLLDDAVSTPTDDEIRGMIRIGGGVEATMGLLDYADYTLKPFKTTQELMRSGLPEASQLKDSTRREVRKIFNEPHGRLVKGTAGSGEAGKPRFTVADADRLLDLAQTGPETPSLMRSLQIKRSKPYESLEELADGLCEYQQLKRKRVIDSKEKIFRYLTDPFAPVFSTLGNATKNITMEDVTELHDVAGSGEEAAAILRTLEEQKQTFPSFQELRDAVAGEGKKRKAAIRAALMDPEDGLLPPGTILKASDIDIFIQESGTADPLVIKRAAVLASSHNQPVDLRRLAAFVEVSHASILTPLSSSNKPIALGGEGKEETNNLMDLLKAPNLMLSASSMMDAEPDPRARVVTNSQKFVADFSSVSNLPMIKEGKEGPQRLSLDQADALLTAGGGSIPYTLELVESFRDDGKVFDSAEKLQEALQDEKEKRDAQKVLDYLSEPTTFVLKDDALPATLPQGAALIKKGQGVDKTLDLLDFHNKRGLEYASVQELEDNLLIPAPHVQKQQELLEQFVNSTDQKQGLLSDPIEKEELQLLYFDVRAGPETGAIAQTLSEAKKKFESRHELSKAMSQERVGVDQDKRMGKLALAEYLVSPECKVLSASAKRDDPPKRRQVHQLFALENSLPGTVALLSELEKDGQCFDSTPELIQAAKDLSNAKRKELASFLSDPSSKLFGENGTASDGEEVARLVEAGQAGIETLGMLKDLEAQGVRVDKMSDLIPHLKAARLQAPVSQGSAFEATAALMGELGTKERNGRAALLKYLKSDEVDLLNSTSGLGLPDMDPILAEGDGVHDTIDLCEYLNRVGRHFDSPPELGKHLQDGQLPRREVKRQIHHLLGREEGKKLLPLAVDPASRDAAVEQIYKLGKAGPTTAAQARMLVEQGRTFTTPEEMGAAIRQMASDEKRKRRKEKKALKKFLADGECSVLPEESLPVIPLNSKKKKMTHRQVNDLYRLENSGPGTAALLDALAQTRLRAQSVPDLQKHATDYSRQKHRELRTTLAQPESTLNKGKPAIEEPTLAQVRRISEESWTGPLSVPLVKQIETRGVVVEESDDLTPIVRKERLSTDSIDNQDGLAAEYMEAEDAVDMAASVEEVMMLRAFLTLPTMEIMQDCKEMLDSPLLSVLETCGGLENAVAMVDALNEEGARFSTVEALDQELQARLNNGVEANAKLNSLIGAFSNMDSDQVEDQVEDVLEDIVDIHQAPAAMFEVMESIPDFACTPEQIDLVKAKIPKLAKAERKARRALTVFLGSPSCPIFTPEGNKTKEVTLADSQSFWDIEGGKAGTGALINAMKHSRSQSDTTQGLIHAAKRLSGTRTQETLAEMQRGPLFANPSMPQPNLLLAKDISRTTQAGPRAAEALRGLARIGFKPTSYQDLEKEVFLYVKEKQKLENKDLTESELAAGFGPNVLDSIGEEEESDELTAGAALFTATKEDVQALTEYLSDPNNFLLTEDAQLQTPDLVQLLEAGEGLDNTVRLCDYLLADGKQYDSAPAIVAALPYAKMLRDGHLAEVKKLLQDNDKKLFAGADALTDQEIQQLVDDGRAGPDTALHLRSFAADKQHFDTKPALVEKLKAAKFKADQARKKDRALLTDFFNDVNNPILAVKPGAQPVSEQEVNRLFAIEKSGPAIASLLDELMQEKEQVQSMAKLAQLGASKSAKARVELADFLAEPELWHAQPGLTTRRRRQSLMPIAASISQESEAGLQVLDHLKSLCADGRKFNSLDDILDEIRNLRQKKKLRRPRGAAEALALGQESAASDPDKLKEFLGRHDMFLLKDDAPINEEGLQDIIQASQGLDSALDLCTYLNERGESYPSIQDLLPHLKEAKEMRSHNKKRMKELVNQQLLVEQAQLDEIGLEDMYRDVGAGPATGSLARALVDQGLLYEDPDDLFMALQKSSQDAKLEKQKEKVSIGYYLPSPECTVLTDAAKQQPVSRRDVHALYALENSLPGTVALLNELERNGDVFDSMPALLAAAKELSSKRKQEVQQYLADPKAKLFDQAADRDVKEDSGPLSVANLVEESEAGPETLAVLKHLEAQGFQVSKTDDLIPLVKGALFDTPVAKPGAASVATAASMGQLDSHQDHERAELLKFLKDEEVDLLPSAKALEPEDMDCILAKGDGLQDTLDLCEYLNRAGRHFDSPADLADHLHDALVPRGKVKEQLKLVVSAPEGKPLLATMATPAIAEQIYKNSQAGPETSAVARQLQAEGKQFASPEELSNALKDQSAAKKRQRKKEKEALKQYLESSDCVLMPDAGPESMREINDLYRIEQSGPGTAALLDELAENKVVADSMAKLQAEAVALSKKKRASLREKMAQPESCLNAGKPVAVEPPMESVARLVEESEAGPAAQAMMEPLEKTGVKVNDLDQLTPLLREEVKKAKKNPKPAAAFMESVMAVEMEAELEDVASAKELLFDSAIPLVMFPEGVDKDSILKLLDAGGGLEETMQAMRALTDAGNSYSSIEDLTAAVVALQAKAGEQSEAVRQALLEAVATSPTFLTFSPEELPVSALEYLVQASGLMDCPAAILALAADQNNVFANVEQLAAALRAARKDEDKELKNTKKALQNYLADPSNPLLSDVANKEKKVNPSDAQKIFDITGDAAQAGALLNALEEAGQKYESVPELQAAAEKLNAERSRELGQLLLDLPKHPDVHKFKQQCSAGPAAAEVVKQVLAKPEARDRPDALLPEVDNLFAAKQSIPRKDLSPAERAAGLGTSPLAPWQVEASSASAVSDGDVEKMLDYFASPDCEILDYAEELDPADVRELIDNADQSLERTVQLCDYLNADGEQFEDVPEVIRRIHHAKDEQAQQIVQVEEMLQPIQGKSLFTKPNEVKVGRTEARQVCEKAGAKTAALLNGLKRAEEPKTFDTVEELAEAVGDAHEAKKQRTRKEKNALRDYLNQEDNPLFTPSGNASKQSHPVGKAEVNKLFRDNKSGLGAAATLDDLLKSGQKFDSPIDLLEAAEAHSNNKHAELDEYLTDPECKAVTAVVRAQFDASSPALRYLEQEGEAGPNTKRHLESLAEVGRTFDSVPEMVPAISKFAQMPTGPAGEAVLACRNDSDDVEKLMDYFARPDINLVDRVEDMPDPEVQAILAEGQGLENTIDLCDYLNKDFSEFSALPELIPALSAKARPKRREVKERMKAILNAPGCTLLPEPVTSADVDFVYQRVGAGPNSGALVRAIADQGKAFASLEELVEALQKGYKKTDQKLVKDKNALQAYLQTPDCPLFKNAAENRDVDYGTVSQLFRIEQSPQGTALLLDSLIASNQKFDSLPEIIAACKAESARKRQELGKSLADPKNALFTPGTEAMASRPSAVAILAEETEAGPGALPLLQDYLKTRQIPQVFPSVEGLIPVLKSANKPGLGPSSLALPQPYEASSQDINKLLDYFADPEVDLLAPIVNLTASDVSPVIQEAGSARDAMDLCEYLNAVGRVFQTGQELADNLQDAIPIRQQVKKEMLQLLSDVKKVNLEPRPTPVDNAVVDVVYDTAGAGPRIPPLLREHTRHVTQGKIQPAKTPEELGGRLSVMAGKEKAQRMQDKRSMQDFLNSPGAKTLLVEVKEVSMQEINALYRIENSGKGTMALLNAMEAQGKQYSEIHELISASKVFSAGKRLEVLEYLESTEGEALFTAPKYNRPKIAQVVELAEMSQAGPAVLMHIKQARFMDLKVDEYEDLMEEIVEMHENKLNAEDLTDEEKQAGLGGHASQAISKAAGAHEPTEEDLEVLMDLFSSEDCWMMNAVQELEPEDLKHLVQEGQSLNDALILCHYLNYRNAAFTSVPELTTAIKGARAEAVSAKSQVKELLATSSVLPGDLGAKLTGRQFEALYQKAYAGPLMLPLLRDMVDENKQCASVEALGEELNARWKAEVEVRKKHWAAVKSWLEGKHGSCRVWKGEPKEIGDVPMSAIRRLFLNEQTGYGTAALLHQLQVGGAACTSVPELLAVAEEKSKAKRAEIFTKLTKQAPEIFRVPTQVTDERVKNLCEEALIGPALVGFISSLGQKKKFLQWPDLHMHVRRLYEPVKDPLNVLNEHKPVEAMETKITVTIDSKMVDTLTEKLGNPKSNLMVKKDTMNDRLLVWLIREAGGFTNILLMIERLESLGASFPDMSALTKAIRFELRIQGYVISYLTAEGNKMLATRLEPVPLKYTRGATEEQHPTQEKVMELWKQSGLGLALFGALEALEEEGKGKIYPDVAAVGKVLAEKAKEAHAQLAAYLGDVECPLLTSFGNVTKHELNALLYAGGGSTPVTKMNLDQVAKAGQRFDNVAALTEAVRKRVGTALMV
eukprot:gb/GEZN01000012.1/.p1 GENE.gb/GEZN01000012.1/~~gb/GEZN01000012.1/.p1  ORF type:complete len:4989 (+),score=1206.50 gb/GEZN01000012.1/:84-15050(+)